MRVRCPNCEAGYEVEDAAIGPSGRSVRCAACGTVWRVDASANGDSREQSPLPPAGATFPEAAPEPEVAPPYAGPVRVAEPAVSDPGPAGAGSLAAVLPPPAAAEPTPATPPAAYGGSEEHASPATEDRPRLPVAVWVGWLVTFAVLGTAAWAAVQYRAEVMAAWPPSERIYTAIGLHHPPQ